MNLFKDAWTTANAPIIFPVKKHVVVDCLAAWATGTAVLTDTAMMGIAKNQRPAPWEVARVAKSVSQNDVSLIFAEASMIARPRVKSAFRVNAKSLLRHLLSQR